VKPLYQGEEKLAKEVLGWILNQYDMSKTGKKKKIIQREKARFKRAKPTIVKNLLKDHLCKNCHWSFSYGYRTDHCTNPIRGRRHKSYPSYLLQSPYPKEQSCQYWEKRDKYA